MNYWTELTKIENSLIRLDMLLGAIRTMSGGVESASISDIQNAFHFIEENLESISKNANADFLHLWSVVRNDSFNEIADEYQNNITQQNIDELTELMNSWIKQ